MSPQLTRIVVTGQTDEWRDAGFTVSGDRAVHIGSTSLELTDSPDNSGIVSLVVAGTLMLDEPDGLPLHGGGADPSSPAEAVNHANHVTAIDHVVAMTPSLDRTADALAASGLELRRRRDAERDGHEVHQLFYWLGDVILEVVEDPRLAADAPARCWGLALTVDDLDASKAALGSLMSDLRSAVQQGRRIASLKRDAGLSVPIAFMSPHVGPS